MSFLLEILERAPVTAITGFLSGVLSFFGYIGVQYFWSRWLLRRMRNEARIYASKHGGLREHALVVSVLTDIQQDARSFLASVQNEAMPLTSIHRRDGFRMEPADWLLTLDAIKKDLRTIREASVDCIHLFTNLPVAMNAMLGALLSNGAEVIVYHFAAGQYHPIGRIAPDVTRL